MRANFDLVIVGAGVSGLALAYYLEQLAKQKKQSFKIAILEAAGSTGGKLKTSVEHGFVIDHGPDSIATRQSEVYELIQKLGIETQVIAPTQRRFSIYRDSELNNVDLSLLARFPQNLGAYLRTDLLSWPAKFRAALGVLLSQLFTDAIFESKQEQSLAAYFCRKYGRQAFNKLLSPLFSGLYGGDLDTISEKTFKTNTSSSTRKLAPYISFKAGIQSLIYSLEAGLDNTKLFRSATVSTISKQDDQWKIEFTEGNITAQQLVLAISAEQSAKVLSEVAPHLSAKLQKFTAKDAAIMTLAFKMSELKNSKIEQAGSGVIIPEGQSEFIRGITISSNKWANRSESQEVLLRVFAREGVFEKLDEGQRQEVALKELRRILGITAQPIFTKQHLWPKGSLHFAVGHFDRLNELTKAAADLGSLKFLGSSFGGIGIGDCIQAAKTCANEIFESLQKTECQSRQSVMEEGRETL